VVVYIGGVFEKNTLTGAIRKYHTGLGRTVAFRDVPAGTGQGTLSSILTDHLGSTVEVTNAVGTTVSETAYWPYGATRSGGVTQTDQRYTQQRETVTTMGAYFYKARFYSTAVGRFVSAAWSGDDLNRYTYVRKNPLTFTDPSGLDCETPYVDLCPDIVADVVVGVSNYAL